MKKQILNTESPNQDSILYGIVSSVSDYRLAWLLNNKFNIELKKIEDLQIEIRTLEATSCHSRYSTKDELAKLEILTNKDANSLKLFKLDFDFFLKFNNEFNDSINIKKELNEITEILLANEIVADKHINDKTIKKILLSFS